MKALKSFLFFSVLLTVIFSCGGDDNIVRTPTPEEPTPTLEEPTPTTPPSSEPEYEYTQEKVYLFEIKGYSDVFKFFKKETKVTQTNPDAIVSDTVLRQMEDSINNSNIIYDTTDSTIAKIGNVGIDFNNSESNFDCLRFSVDTARTGEFLTPDKYITKKYTDLGREYIIDLYNKQNVSMSLFTFDTEPNTFHLHVRTDFRQNPVGFEEGENPEFGIFNNNDNYGYEHSLFNGSLNLLAAKIKIPQENKVEFYLVYDRFHDREYVTADDTVYKTAVVVKKLSEIKDIDLSASRPRWTLNFQPGHTYPVMQFYKNGELWMEAWVSKYVEYLDYDRSSDKTRTDVSFDCYLLKNGCFYEIEYGERCLTIQVLDYAHSSIDADFTRIDTRHINFVSEWKEDGKETIMIQ